MYTDHPAVKAVLETPNPSGKHARWWTRVYGRGVKEVQIVYRAGRENTTADALSRSPQAAAPVEGIADDVQIATVNAGKTKVTESQPTEEDISSLLEKDPSPHPGSQSLSNDYAAEQAKDVQVKEIVDFLEKGDLPEDQKRARKVVAQGPLFAIVNGILYFRDPKHGNRKRAVVPHHLRKQVLEESHSGPLGGHFSGNRLYNALVRHWWWEGMYVDAQKFSKSCLECAIVTGGGRHHQPPLHPIPVQCPFQIMGVDNMELPWTEKGNKYVVVFQDLFSKWPMVFPVPDQKAIRLAS